ncbi:MAG: hypothetical protein RLO52_42735 [Sandaracinaceae bacterium]
MLTVALDTAWASAATGSPSMEWFDGLVTLLALWHERGLAAFVAVVLGVAAIGSSASRVVRAIVGAAAGATALLVPAGWAPAVAGAVACFSFLRAWRHRDAGAFAVSGGAVALLAVAHAPNGWPPESAGGSVDDCAAVVRGTSAWMLGGLLVAASAFVAAARSRAALPDAALSAMAAGVLLHQAGVRGIERTVAGQLEANPQAELPWADLSLGLGALDLGLVAAAVALALYVFRCRPRSAAAGASELHARVLVISLVALVAAVDVTDHRCMFARARAAAVEANTQDSRATGALSRRPITSRLPHGPHVLLQSDGRGVVLDGRSRSFPAGAPIPVPYDPTEVCYRLPPGAPLSFVTEALERSGRAGGWASLCEVAVPAGAAYARRRSALLDSASVRMRAVPIAIGEMNGAREVRGADGSLRPTRHIEIARRPTLAIASLDPQLEVIIAPTPASAAQPAASEPLPSLVSGLQLGDLALSSLALGLVLVAARARESSGR